MATVNEPSTTDQARADAEEVARLAASGQRVTDPELRRRIQERADRVRREMLEAHGLTNIAVDLVRECRTISGAVVSNPDGPTGRKRSAP